MLYESVNNLYVSDESGILAKKKTNEKSNTKTIQTQINWEAENGNLPARRAEPIAADAGIADLQRKAGYDANIDNRITNIERILNSSGVINGEGIYLWSTHKEESRKSSPRTNNKTIFRLCHRRRI